MGGFAPDNPPSLFPKDFIYEEKKSNGIPEIVKPVSLIRVAPLKVTPEPCDPNNKIKM